jgi:hypothetical protein
MAAFMALPVGAIRQLQPAIRLHSSQPEGEGLHGPPAGAMAEALHLVIPEGVLQMFAFFSFREDLARTPAKSAPWSGGRGQGRTTGMWCRGECSESGIWNSESAFWLRLLRGVKESMKLGYRHCWNMPFPTRRPEHDNPFNPIIIQ